MDFIQSLSEWSRDKPLSILQLDPADRAVLKIADERDTVQKKTFTKWLNKHLKKHWRYLKTYAYLHVCYSCEYSCDCCAKKYQVEDLFEDLRDGNKLISLLEVLSGELLSREKGKMRFHHLQNVQIALEFLTKRNVKLVNIRPDDIVDGNPKLTLGLIWTIILHFQISDINMEDMSARAALLKWSQQTTEGYPGVKVTDFTTSWRDGLALNAILHRNRPDLFDFRSLKPKNAKDNLESAFNLAEKEFGITKLLDAEDVDTPQPDEKSLMTYIISLYDVFPDPPNHNPFADTMLIESSKFRSEELSKRLQDKQKLPLQYKEIQESNQYSIQREMHIEEFDKAWDQTTAALKNREQKIHDEFSRVEKSQRLVDKFTRESKLCVERIEDIEKRIFEEGKRSPDDVKQKWDQMKNDFKFIDETLKVLQKDLLIIQEKGHPQTTEMQFRLQSLKDRSQQMKEAFQSGQSEKIRVEKTKPKIKEPNIKQSLKEHFDWIDKKHKRIQALDFGSDLQSIKANLEQLKIEQKTIDQYRKKFNTSSPQKNIENGDAEKLQQKFNDLVSFSDQKQQEFEMLLDFIQASSKELKWMNTIEETEIARDWSAKNLNLVTLEHHQETLTSDLEKREINMNGIQSQGENLLLQNHPGSKCVEEYLSKMQNQWSWLLQLTFCLEVHLRYAQIYHKFFREIQESEQWLKRTEDKLNSTFNKTISSIEEGEQTLQQMDSLRQDLTKYRDVICSVGTKAPQVVPLKQRRVQPSKPIPIVALCTYKSSHATISKDDRCLLKEISNRMWKVLINGKEAVIPSVCFVIPPPNSEAMELAQSLKKHYEDLFTLWAQKQKKVRQNLIFATIKVVKSWNQPHVRNVDVLQRESILKALNSDANELIQECSDSEPALLKLKQEMEQCNALFTTLVNKMPDIESDQKSVEKKLSDTILGLQTTLNEKEKFIKNKLQAHIEWDLDSLEELVIEHKKFDMELREMEDQINTSDCKKSKKKGPLQIKYDNLLRTWEKMWQLSNSYIEKLKTVEVALHQFNEATQIVSSIEVKLASSSNLSSNLQDLQSVHDTLLAIQVELQASQSILDDVQESSRKLKAIMTRVRTKQANHADINKFESDLKKLLVRWESAKSQIVERLRSCGASYELLSTYKNKVAEDNLWISETTVKLNSLKTVKKMTTKEIEMTVEPSMNLYSSISEKSFEETNTLGARYIREAKIYELRLEHYKDSLEEEHPSLDACLQKSTFNSGVSGIEIEIVNLSQRYSSLMRAISDYVTELTEAFTAHQNEEEAVQENFKVCESNTTQLELWMRDVEEKLADIGAIEGHLPGLQLQIYTVKVLKDELENKQNLITTCLDQMRNLAQRGLEVLSKEEINYLQKNLVSVREHYDALLNECNRCLRRLTSAFEELQKYRSEVQTFKEWLIEVQQEFKRIYLALGDLNGLENKSETIRKFTSDVIAHQADLRFIKIAAQKFIDESQEYLKILNAFRTNLPKKLMVIKASESEIKREVQEVTTVFHNFLNEVNKLSDNYSSICSRYRSYTEIVEKAQIWMSDVKKSSQKVLEEPVADEPSAIQNQLNKANLINMEVVGQGRLVENIYQTWKILADTLEACRVAPKDTKIIENTINSLQDDYSEIHNKIVHRINELQIALIHSQDIQGGIDRFLKWLEEAETKFHQFDNEQISLIIDKLESQVHNCKILKSDIHNQTQSLEMLKSIEISASTNSKLAKKVDVKLKDISQRFEKLFEKVLKKCQLLEQVAEKIRAFEELVKQFDAFCISALERIEGTDNILHSDIDGFSSVIEYILNERDSRKKDFDQIIKLGKDLIQLKEVSDVSMVKDKIYRLEQQWKKLGDCAIEKKQLLTARSEQVTAYETLRAKVQDWFLKIEKDLEKLEPLAMDLAVLKKQANETMDLLKEHSEYSSTIEKLNLLGNTCDMMTSKEKTEIPLRKGGISQKSRSSDLVKGSPKLLSKKSTDIKDFTPVQHQLCEINDRYSTLKVKLSDRNVEVTSITEEIKSFSSSIKVFMTFIDLKRKQLSKEETSKETADNRLKILKEIEKEMIDKQSQVDNLKISILSMLSKRERVKGSAELEQELKTVEKRWTSLSTTIQENLHLLQNLKECQDVQQIMRKWLNQKEKMFQVLGPIASEPRMLYSQVQQVQVLREEFTSQTLLMTRLTELGASDEEIERQWKDLSRRLLEREKELETASTHTKQLHKLQKELTEKLQTIAEKLEKYEEKGGNMDILLKKLMELEEELEKLRPLIKDTFRICEQLCHVISDSSSKTEIMYKVDILEKSYLSLKKRIDDKKSEVQSFLKKDQVFFKVCEEIQAWLNATDSSLSHSAKISGNNSKLSKQIEEYEVLYNQIINKDHDIYLCLSQGADVVIKIPNKQEVTSMKGKLDSIKKQYEKIKKSAIDRHTNMHSCLESCKKYQAVVDSFVPWLQEKEKVIQTFKLASLKHQTLNKQLKEMQIMKSELSVHHQTYQNVQQFGDAILSYCECDTETTKQQLEELKTKWKRINNVVVTKVQFLEELSQVLLEYEEKFRDVQHEIQRLEDKMCSHDYLDASCDPVFLNRFKALLQEATALKEKINDLKKLSKTVSEKAGETSAEIVKNVEDIERQYNSLKSKLEERYSSFSASHKVISVFKEQINTLRSELCTLEECFDKLRPIARDLKILTNQLNETKELKSNLLQTKKKYSTTKKIYDNMNKQEESKVYLEQINTINRQISRLEEHICERETTIETMITRIGKFYTLYSDTDKKVKSLLKKEETFDASLGDVRTQQQKLKNMHSSEVLPLSKHIVEVNKIGHGLVQSATSGLDTSDIERKMDNLNNVWNSLQVSFNEKEKKFEIALIQSGKFQEALSGVQKWIVDTEEMVSHQKLPSSDLKVVKAQVEEQKFLKKMLVDRHSSVVALKALETEISSTSKTQDEKLLINITTRFDELISTSEKRMNTLETIIPVAQEFQNTYSSFTEWLETIDKRLNTLSTIPVEENQVLSMIKEQKKVSTEIADHEPSLKKLNIISEKFKKIVNPNESASLQQKIQLADKKFYSVKSSCDNISSLLNEAQKGIGNFSTKYTKIISLIDDTALQLTHFQVLSIDSKKLQSQFIELQKLKERLNAQRKNIADVTESGERIMKLTSGNDSIQIKEKVDSLTIKLSEISEKLNERLETAEECLHLMESYSSSFSKLTSWLDSLEHSLRTFDRNSLDIQSESIKKMEDSVSEHRSILDIINHDGSRITQLSSKKGSTVIQNQMSTVNQRFEKISEHVQMKSKEVNRNLQRKFEIINEMKDLSDWYKETEKQIVEVQGIVSEPNTLTTLLKEHKSLCEDVSVHMHQVRDITSTALKMDCKEVFQDKVANLRAQCNRVSSLCQERLHYLEEAYSLAQNFYETHSHLEQWLNQVEHSNDDLARALPQQKPLVQKLEKTASALTKFCQDVGSNKIEMIVDSDTSRYDALQKILREQQIALEEALRASSQFSDQLDGLFSTLTSTADQLTEPIAAHPERIQKQIKDNNVVLEDLDQRKLETVHKTAEDVLKKVNDQPAVQEIRFKVDRLNDMWLSIQTAARKRGNSLEEALVAAERFWNELKSVTNAINELQNHLECQEAPAVEPEIVQQQQQTLVDIKNNMSERKPQVDHCRQSGQYLMQLCGEPDKLKVQKSIENLDSVWENVTTLYYKREQNLISAMDKAMGFHETMQNLLEFLDTSEDKFSKFGDVPFDIDSVKSQITLLKVFKMEVDHHMIEVESLNHQAKELMTGISSKQSISIQEPLNNINRRWNNLLKSIGDRQREMDNALLKLGQFQHALEEQMSWISKTEKSLVELKPVYGDTLVMETVLAKHKVITNDIENHQSSIDAINRAGLEFLRFDHSSEEAKPTQNKLHTLQKRWKALQDSSVEQYKELEEALRETKKFQQDMQDIFSWLNQTDEQLNNTKPVGGLPETAREQMDKFMDLYNELNTYHSKVEDVLQQGHNYLNKSGDKSPKALQQSLRSLKLKWDSVLSKANDRKIKLEISLRETMEFHESLQDFVEWLTNGEKYITGLKPVSRHLKTVLEQIEEHRVFQKDLGVHREVMLALDKKGTHFKYFSRKQDVAVIKNVLSSVQQRWEKLVSKAAERTRALDHGYKEAKQFHDAYVALSVWLDEAEKLLDDTTPIGNDPVKIKKMISKHREFQKSLGTKQASYDSTMKLGHTLKDKSPDFEPLQSILDELKQRWNNICLNSVNRQRKLEEALLCSGQFKEAVLGLMDWLNKTIKNLSEKKPYHGDLDTVTSLIDQHNRFEEELKNRGLSLENISKTSLDLKKQASVTDVESISSEVDELNEKWKTVNDLSEKKKADLFQARELAKQLSEMVHPLLEWLSDAENKLRFCGSLPEDEESTRKEIATHENFMQEMAQKEEMKTKTLGLAHHILQRCHPEGVIRQWITILNSRWEEISNWAQQREKRLRDHLMFLKDIQDRIEELLAWLSSTESSLISLEALPLPDDMTTLDRLIQEHQVVINDMTKKQTDVERITKASKPTKDSSRSSTGRKSASQPNETDIKHPRAKLLLEKWRAVWLLAMERQRRLQDRRNYIHELHRMKHFDFNAWRKRYLSWLHNDRDRIMDQYKKIDKNGVGKVTKQEFIDEILQSKFSTSRLEMERVADIFDRNGDGFIDKKEYMETLLPQREPQTEAEKIQDEVERQVAKCTCVNRFKVYQVGEGKYRFGDSQKLRLVRILRSTVMVRVGGGWVALDEFLVKNDPCRAKGRTNLELREQFILADGVSQSMTPFKTKHASDSGSLPSTGPITKIREKSERSTPMRPGSSADESFGSSTSDSFNNRSSSGRPSQSRLSSSNAGYKSSSCNTSQPGSQSSQAPSNTSQDETEDFTRKHKKVPGNGIKLSSTNSSNNTKRTKLESESSKIPSVKKLPKQPSNESLKKIEMEN